MAMDLPNTPRGGRSGYDGRIVAKVLRAVTEADRLHGVQLCGDINGVDRRAAQEVRHDSG